LTSSGDTRKISKDDKILIESWRKEKPWDAKNLLLGDDQPRLD